MYWKVTCLGINAAEIHKESSIYDVHKNIVFLASLPLVNVHMPSTWKTHHFLETACTSPSWPTAKTRLKYYCNLFKTIPVVPKLWATAPKESANYYKFSQFYIFS